MPQFSPSWLLSTVAALGLAACASPDPAYKKETFAVDSPYQLVVPQPPEVACEAARRALLGQGYIIDSATAAQVRGKKAFRNSVDESAALELNVVCVARGAESTLFANAVENLYTVKKNAQSASVGVPIIGSISVPVTGSSESLVKTSEATVTDKGFYRGFFSVVEHHLRDMAATPMVTETAPISPPPPPLQMQPTPAAPTLPPSAPAAPAPVETPEPPAPSPMQRPRLI